MNRVFMIGLPYAVASTARPCTGRPASFHCSIPRRRTLTWREAGCTQGPRSRCRAFVGPADKDEWGAFKPGKLGQSAIKLGNRNIARGRDMAERSGELVGSPHVDRRLRLRRCRAGT